MNTIGNIIRYKRRQLGLTQKQLAENLKVSHTTVNLWEKGNVYPSAMCLCDLADQFHCSVDELMGRKNVYRVVRRR